MRRIVYIGASDEGSTSLHRISALRRLGCEVLVADPYRVVRSLRMAPGAERLHRITGQKLLVGIIERWVTKHVVSDKAPPDVVWINGGELLSPKALRSLQRFGVPIVLYNNDDPFGARDSNRFYQVARSLSLYDLCVTMRSITAGDLAKRGARRVLQVSFSYDEVEHRPLIKGENIPEEFMCDVVFVGSYIASDKRDIFLECLSQAGVSVAIWGQGWNHSKQSNIRRNCWRGRAVVARDYVYAISGAKVALGLLSKGNRDKHTTRSVEIPFIGGLLCAERTDDHAEMYADGEEAALWSSPQECVQVCRDLLSNDSRRRAIQRAGMRRVRELTVGNEDVCRAILNEIGA
jgi:spore maturation protein CgeB